jgi:hypothetical protein
MNKRKLLSLVAVIFCLASFGVSAYAVTTINMYRHAVPCGKLLGFVGLLQSAHFIPSGGCKVLSDGSCNDNAVCRIIDPPSGSSSNGHCTTTTLSKNKFGCVCVSK